MKQKVAIYARVSTLQQEQEATIESQVAALEEYAAKQGYELPAENYFLDEAVSGSRLERPSLDRLRDQAPEGKFSTILCLSPDRLARQYVHQWVLLDELQRTGVKMVFINQPTQMDGAQGQLLTGMQGLFAEYERAMITERMRRGKLYRIRKGQLLSPNPPYGYRYIPVTEINGGCWQICEQKAEIVRAIYQWYTVEQLTISSIANRLNEKEIATPSPRGRAWQYSSVRAILKQQAYTGRTFYNRTRRRNDAIGRPRKSGRGYLRTADHEERPREEWIAVSTPVIVAEFVWQQAQERLQMNKKFAQRNNKRHVYLLRSLLVCSTCGRTLTGRTNSNGSFYRCPNGGNRRSPDAPLHSCTIPGYIIEPLVWQEITRWLHNPTLMIDAWQSQNEGMIDNPDEVERLQIRQRKLERQWVRLLDLYQDSLIDKTEVEKRKARLDDARQVLEERLRQQTHQTRQAKIQAETMQNFTAFAKKIEASLESPSSELQQEVIRLLIDHIVIEQDAIVIKHIIPADDDCRLTSGHR